MGKFLKFIFSDIRTYIIILFILIPTVFITLLTLDFRSKQIVEVLDQLEVPDRIIEVSNLKPDSERQNLYTKNESQGIFGSNDFLNGGLTGEVRLVYNFSDGSSSLEVFNIEDYFDQKVPGKGSKRLIKSFVKGKYKIRSGETVDLSSKKKLTVGDYSSADFKPAEEWTDIKSYNQPMDLIVNSTRLVTNGKVSSRQEIPRKITIKLDSETEQDNNQ